MAELTSVQYAICLQRLLDLRMWIKEIGFSFEQNFMGELVACLNKGIVPSGLRTETVNFVKTMQGSILIWIGDS